MSDSDDEISLTPSVREYVLAAHDRTCKKCGASDDECELEIHHITPRSEGGSNDPSNLTVYCRDCHTEHHNNSTSSGEEDKSGNLNGKDMTTTGMPEAAPAPADRRILAAVEDLGPASTGQIADEADVTPQYARQRLYALGSAKVVAMTEDKTWDLMEQVDNPVAGKLPDDPEQAARFARDDIMRRMSNTGMDHAEIADIVGLDERTVPTAINRARAFDPPLPPVDDGDTVDQEDLHRQLMTLARRVDNLERQT